MIGSLIGAGLQVAGSIIGGIKASKAAKKAKRHVESQRRDNRDWFNRRYYEDATQRGDAQRVLTKTAEAIRERNRQAAGVQAVMGGTDESVAAAKRANSEALANAASGIVANADARKDAIEAQYMERDAQLSDKLAGIEQNRANETAKAIEGVGSAAAKIGGAVDSYMDSRVAKPEAQPEKLSALPKGTVSVPAAGDPKVALENAIKRDNAIKV